jgi:hypothetical protein
MEKVLVEALEQSLARLEAGQSLEDCLQAYPELADALRPLLETTQRAIAARPSEIPSDVLQRSRARLLSQAVSLRTVANSRRLQLPRLVPAIAAAVLVLLTGSRVIAASAQSLPGDPLYPVKRTVERVNLQIAAENRRADLREEFRQRRTEETQALLYERREEDTSLFGLLAEKDGNRLLVGGIWIEIIEPIPGDDELEIGDYLEVEGRTTSKGFLAATEMQRLAYELRGTLQFSGDGTWSIDGFQIVAEDGEKLEGYLSGDVVMVRVELDEVGSPRVKGVEDIPAQESNEPGKDDAHQGENDLDPDEYERAITIIGELEAQTLAYLRVSGSYFLIGLESEIENNLKTGDQVKVEAFKVGAGPYILDKAERAGEEDHIEAEAESESESESESEAEEEHESEFEPDDDDPSEDDD